MCWGSCKDMAHHQGTALIGFSFAAMGEPGLSPWGRASLTPSPTDPHRRSQIPLPHLLTASRRVSLAAQRRRG
jgi:hypothetical protein